jgi:uncharacterized protein YndB with AHSA1/START domain
MQHLDVLTGAKLVLVERRGRERWNYLNAMPLHAMYRRWVNRFADDLAGAADRLKQLSEIPENPTQRSDPMPPPSTAGEVVRAVELKLEYTIQAPPARVWQIMTRRTNEWWKRANFYLRPDAVAFHIDLRAGGHLWEEYADGGSVLWWTITEVAPEKALGLLSIYPGGSTGLKQEHTRIELVASGDGCIVKLHQIMTGVIRDADEALKPFIGGWNQLFEEGLKPLAEESAGT